MSQLSITAWETSILTNNVLEKRVKREAHFMVLEVNKTVFCLAESYE